MKFLKQFICLKFVFFKNQMKQITLEWGPSWRLRLTLYVCKRTKVSKRKVIFVSQLFYHLWIKNTSLSTVVWGNLNIYLLTVLRTTNLFLSILRRSLGFAIKCCSHFLSLSSSIFLRSISNCCCFSSLSSLGDRLYVGSLTATGKLLRD